MRIVSILLFALLPVLLPAAQVVLEKKGDAYRFGTADFSITIDAKTGNWSGLEVDGKNLMENRKGIVSCDPFIGDWKSLSSGKSPIRLIKAEEEKDQTLAVTTGTDEYRLVTRYQLFPERHTLRTRVVLTGPSDHTVIIRGFQFRIPEINFTGESAYTIPGMYPPFKPRHVSDLVPGQKEYNWEDPYPVVVQINPNSSLLFAVDATPPYGERCRTIVSEQSNGILVTLHAAAAGRLKPGTSMELGDFYCVLIRGPLETAIAKAHTWMRHTGLNIPRDRPEWLGSAVLYSFHPGGLINHAHSGWGGFTECIGRLPRLRALNCNTLWLLPLEDGNGPYIPDDYYKLAEGIGTPEEYKAFVAAAHRQGFKVWQDLVAHGGLNYFSRAKEHPEFLLRDENGEVPLVRCFDYMMPGWQEYLRKWAQYIMETYGVDGFRLDMASGSGWRNWSENIPYGRASFAESQGGLTLQRTIREEVRKHYPDGAVLGECDASLFASTSDVIYDNTFSKHVAGASRTLDAGTFVDNLSRWLYEQQQMQPENALRIRCIENHDMVSAKATYGLPAMRALFALASWVYGVPMLFQENEIGSFAVFRKILEIRRQLPELSGGKADYLACKASPGVFSALRTDGQNVAVPLINFNHKRVRASVEIPLSRLPAELRTLTTASELWSNTSVPLIRRADTLGLEVELPPYGFTVLRIGKPIEVATEPPPAAGRELLPLDGFLVLPDGSRQDVTGKLAAGENVVDIPNDTALLIKVPLHGEKTFWRVDHAAGTSEDEFFTRQPSVDARISSIYSLPHGGNVLWASVFEPFGFTQKQSTVALFNSKGSVRFSFMPNFRPAAVFLLDRLGDDHNPWLFIVKKLPGTPLGLPGDKVGFAISRMGQPEEVSGTGDSRLVPVSGGWLFDNGKIQLYLSLSGTLKECRRKQSDGSWHTVLRNVQPVMERGYSMANKYGMRKGDGRYTAENDVETFSLMNRNEDGTLELRFFGKPRKNRYELLDAASLDYAVTYTLNDSASFGYTGAVRPVSRAWTDEMLLAVGMGLSEDFRAYFYQNGELVSRGRFYRRYDEKLQPLPDEIRVQSAAKQLLFRIHGLSFAGPDISRIVPEPEELLFAWQFRDVPHDQFGVWRSFSGTVAIGEDPGPLPARELYGRAASTRSDMLLDPSFEVDYWSPLPEMVQQFAYSLPWMFPRGTSISTDSPHAGKKSAKIVLDSKTSRSISQKLAIAELKTGETLRLSAFIRGEDLRSSDPDNSPGWLRFVNPDTCTNRRTDEGRYTSVSLPSGSFGYRQFHVDYVVPTDRNGLTVEVGGKGSGVIWVDDIVLTRIPPLPKQ